MAVTQAICNSFKEQLLEGIHDLDTDVLKIALYDRVAATLNASTTVYSSSNESSGTGYTAGGNVLAVTAGFPQLNSSVAEVRFDDEEWISSSFTAGAALIYNSSKANRAIAVLDFGTNAVVVNGTFTVEFPTGNPATLRLL